jgi:hypothetical protein
MEVGRTSKAPYRPVCIDGRRGGSLKGVSGVTPDRARGKENSRLPVVKDL